MRPYIATDINIGADTEVDMDIDVDTFTTTFTRCGPCQAVSLRPQLGLVQLCRDVAWPRGLVSVLCFKVGKSILIHLFSYLIPARL